MQSQSFTKLFSSITDSSIWGEDDATRILWITMLAMADAHGYVGASIPGLAARARKTIAEVELSLAKLMAPDPYSRTRDYEGRRVAESEGGWVLLTYEKHRVVTRAEALKESKRLWAARAREKARLAANDVDESRIRVSTVEQESNSPSVFSSLPSGSDLDPDRARVGELAARVIAEQGPFENAREMHDAVELALTRAGFECKREFAVRTDVVNGFVDLVATLQGVQVAIELDWVTPRGRSLLKLLEGGSWVRIVGLRECGKVPPTIPGIDHVVACVQRQPAAPPAPVDAEGVPVMYRTLDGWEEPPGLEDEALIAGVPREFYRARLTACRNTTIGGRNGVRCRTTWVRQQFGTWKTWAEVDRAKASSGPATGARTAVGGGVDPGGPPVIPDAKVKAFGERHGLDIPAILEKLQTAGVGALLEPERSRMVRRAFIAHAQLKAAEKRGAA